MEETVGKEKCWNEWNKWRKNFQKSGNDEKNEKINKIRKGFNPSFFKNESRDYHKGHLVHDKIRMRKSLGKSPRKETIMCTRYEGDHMYTNFPQK